MWFPAAREPLCIGGRLHWGTWLWGSSYPMPASLSGLTTHHPSASHLQSAEPVLGSLYKRFSPSFLPPTLACPPPARLYWSFKHSIAWHLVSLWVHICCMNKWMKHYLSQWCPHNQAPSQCSLAVLRIHCRDYPWNSPQPELCDSEDPWPWSVFYLQCSCSTCFSSF